MAKIKNNALFHFRPNTRVVYSETAGQTRPKLKKCVISRFNKINVFFTEKQPVKQGENKKKCVISRFDQINVFFIEKQPVKLWPKLKRMRYFTSDQIHVLFIQKQ